MTLPLRCNHATAVLPTSSPPLPPPPNYTFCFSRPGERATYWGGGKGGGRSTADPDVAGAAQAGVCTRPPFVLMHLFCIVIGRAVVPRHPAIVMSARHRVLPGNVFILILNISFLSCKANVVMLPPQRSAMISNDEQQSATHSNTPGLLYTPLRATTTFSNPNSSTGDNYTTIAL